MRRRSGEPALSLPKGTCFFSPAPRTMWEQPPRLFSGAQRRRVPHFSRSLREVGLLAGVREQAHVRPQCSLVTTFYDFNLWGQHKEVEKLKYMHRNPVVRGLVATPEDWRWSSYRRYAYQEQGPVRINDWTWWEEKIRRSTG